MHASRQLAATQPGSILLESSGPAAGLAWDQPGRSLLFTEPVQWLEAHALDELPALFQQLAGARAAGLWAAGYLSYECGYHWEATAAPGFRPEAAELPLAAFGLYRAPAVGASAQPQVSSTGYGVDTLSFSMTREAFEAGIGRIRQWIEAGDTYQVNLTGQVVGACAGDAAGLFTHMMEAQPVPFGALMRIGSRYILSASPELFFALRGRLITVRPMKGTSRRGANPAEDAAFARSLAADPKNRAENIMIVDLLRSDLGRIAEAGSVEVEQLFQVERFPTLMQMSSQITATLRADVDAYGLFGSLFPSGSIVGAPKVRTMQILRELEQRERGVYTGAIGYFAPSGDAVFSVAIRTAVMDEQRVTMGVGAGITYDSDAAAEYDECLLKAAFLQASGFGLIETMRWERGCCALLARHLQRLAASAAYFGFRFDHAQLLKRLAQEAAALPATGAWRLRLVLAADGTVNFSPAQPIEPDTAPLQAMLWPEPVNASDRFLQHKTTRRAAYDHAAATARALGLVDAIFVNKQGEVTEGAIHNVVVRHGGRWRTPPLSAGVLPGVYRAHLLATMPELAEERVTVAELRTADALWLTNAVRGMRGITLARTGE